MADLLGGTTGQILAKASNTNMDFTWITNDVGDITAVNVTSPITGGGSSGAVTIAIQDATTSVKGAVQLSDSTSTTSSVLASTPTATKAAYDLAASAYASGFTNNYFAGKNKIINGDMNIWQRGTTVTDPAGGTFLADRFYISYDGTAPTSRTYSQQTFALGTAPVAGYEGKFFARVAVTTKGSNTRTGLIQSMESVRTFAGQTVTISFWAKCDSARTGSIVVIQNFGTGGSPSSSVTVTDSAVSYSSSWARYSLTVAIPSIAGKTLGTAGNDYLSIQFILLPMVLLSIFGAYRSKLGQSQRRSKLLPVQSVENWRYASATIGKIKQQAQQANFILVLEQQQRRLNLQFQYQ
jgi:hypothetical protein